MCNFSDLCWGADSSEDSDSDGICGDLDECWGDDTFPDTDGDNICQDLDVCFGDDASGDQDSDGLCSNADFCYGDNVWGDTDSNGICDRCPCDPILQSDAGLTSLDLNVPTTQTFTVGVNCTLVGVSFWSLVSTRMSITFFGELFFNTTVVPGSNFVQLQTPLVVSTDTTFSLELQPEDGLYKLEYSTANPYSGGQIVGRFNADLKFMLHFAPDPDADSDGMYS